MLLQTHIQLTFKPWKAVKWVKITWEDRTPNKIDSLAVMSSGGECVAGHVLPLCLFYALFPHTFTTFISFIQFNEHLQRLIGCKWPGDTWRASHPPSSLLRLIFIRFTSSRVCFYSFSFVSFIIISIPHD